MDFANTSICLLTAHLAAGFANYEERNQDYRTISYGLKFQRNRSIEDHDSIIWMGDFNYRLGMSNDRTRQLIKSGDLETLHENDQLHLQMMHGKTFPHYSEARITFMPTYKFNNGTDDYDTSEKARIPAWTDRVLSKGNNLRQTDYNSAPLRFSDHRPVYAIFQCVVSVVDEQTRKAISISLYQKRRRALADGTDGAMSPSDDEDLQDYESIEPGLPPASSDRRKWWLDGGMPAKAKLNPPGDGYVPNEKRPANPWTPSSEPDWVRVERPSPSPKPAAPPPRRAGNGPARPTEQPGRRLPPPYLQQGAKVDPGSDGDGPPPLPSRVSSFPLATVEKSKPVPSTVRKGAPPVPKKPNMLRTASTSSDVSSAAPPALPARNHRDSVASLALSTASEPVPSKLKPGTPPPRRSTATKPAVSTQPAIAKPLIPARHDPPPTNEARRPLPSSRAPPPTLATASSAAKPNAAAKIPAKPMQKPISAKPAQVGPAKIASTRQNGTGAAANLMDDKEGDLQGWEPLKPT